jgi:hypothetical protein
VSWYTSSKIRTWVGLKLVRPFFLLEPAVDVGLTGDWDLGDSLGLTVGVGLTGDWGLVDSLGLPVDVGLTGEWDLGDSLGLPVDVRLTGDWELGNSLELPVDVDDFFGPMVRGGVVGVGLVRGLSDKRKLTPNENGLGLELSPWTIYKKHK